MQNKMGITNHTALVISTRDDILVDHSKDDTGKYAGWITLGQDDYCRPLLNTTHIFDTAEDAEQHMRDLIKEIRLITNGKNNRGST